MILTKIRIVKNFELYDGEILQDLGAFALVRLQSFFGTKLTMDQQVYWHSDAYFLCYSDLCCVSKDAFQKEMITVFTKLF